MKAFCFRGKNTNPLFPEKFMFGFSVIIPVFLTYFPFVILSFLLE